MPHSKQKIFNSVFKLNGFDEDDFLQNYWQQKPLLIKGGLIDFESPLSPNELAGLACEEDIESRLIRGNNTNGFELIHGPLDEKIFETLPENNWTILVQAVDHYVAKVAEIVNYFHFLPRWRIDDIMVSYATTGGSTGPHYDNYDVFLIQGAGSRQWQVGTKYSNHSKLRENKQLHLLANFEPLQEWTLNSGDILYLPPGYGHWGVSLCDECMTYSVGFRAPSYTEILSSFCDDKISKLNEQLRYSEPGLPNKYTPEKLLKPPSKIFKIFYIN